MVRSRALLSPSEATNEGSRLLRELHRKKLTFGAIARRLRCDEASVRRWAYEKGKPNLQLRVRIREVLGIGEGTWDEPPKADFYGSEPETQRPQS